MCESWEFFDLYVIFYDWIYALNMLGLSFDLLRHLMMAHLDRSRSICAHFFEFFEFIYLRLNTLHFVIYNG